MKLFQILKIIILAMMAILFDGAKTICAISVQGVMGNVPVKSLAHLSRRLMCELIIYQ